MVISENDNIISSVIVTINVMMRSRGSVSVVVVVWRVGWVGRNITRTWNRQNYYCNHNMYRYYTRIYNIYTFIVFSRRVTVRFASGAAMRARAQRRRARARGQRDFGTRPGSGDNPHVEHMVSHGGRVPFVVCIIWYYFFFPYRQKLYIYIYIYINHIIYFEVYAFKYIYLYNIEH